MNILITGASRGIGAAAFAALTSAGHRVIGHSSQGSATLVAGDLSDPAAPRNIWDTAADELGGHVDVLVNNAGIYEGVADNAPDDEWHAALKCLLLNPQLRTAMGMQGRKRCVEEYSIKRWLPVMLDIFQKVALVKSKECP